MEAAKRGSNVSEPALSTPSVPWTPPGGLWTVDDLARLPDDGLRYEIIDGNLLVSPPPASRHQRAAHRLTAALNRALDPEWEALEAVGVTLREQSPTKLVVPDVVVARASTVDADAKTLSPADVALLVEVVSPSSVSKDRVLKPAMLAEAGIPAYWRVEFNKVGGATVVLNHLVDGEYVEKDVVRSGEVRQVDWPFAFRLAPAELTGARQG